MQILRHVNCRLVGMTHSTTRRQLLGVLAKGCLGLAMWLVFPFKLFASRPALHDLAANFRPFPAKCGPFRRSDLWKKHHLAG